MTWQEKYRLNDMPTIEGISEYIHNPLWNELCEYIEEKYSVSPKIEYSKCSMMTGWNVKYKKGGKSICTLYPNEGGFVCLVVIGEKEQLGAEMILPDCDEYVQDVYKSQPIGMGQRWLMLEVANDKILSDIKDLISLRITQKR